MSSAVIQMTPEEKEEMRVLIQAELATARAKIKSTLLGSTQLNPGDSATTRIQKIHDAMDTIGDTTTCRPWVPFKDQSASPCSANRSCTITGQNQNWRPDRDYVCSQGGHCVYEEELMQKFGTDGKGVKELLDPSIVYDQTKIDSWVDQEVKKQEKDIEENARQIAEAKAAKRAAEKAAAEEAERERLARIKPATVIGVEVDVKVIEGTGLVGMDSKMFSKKKTSDPYVQVMYPGFQGGNAKKGKTEVKSKTLDPKWDHPPIKVAAYGNSYKNTETIVMAIYDHDMVSDDDSMGMVSIPIGELVDACFDKYKAENRGHPPPDGEEFHDIRVPGHTKKKFPVENTPDCTTATGTLTLEFDVKLCIQ